MDCGRASKTVLGRNAWRRLSNYLCALMVKIGDIELSDFPLLLAPMEDVSDPPFRALCKEQGADVVYTEFISSEGLIRDAAKSVMKLDIYEAERPVGIQIFGANLDSMLQSVDIVEKTNPDIIDINFGCPVKKVVSKGAGRRDFKRYSFDGFANRRNGQAYPLASDRKNTPGLGSRQHPDCGGCRTASRRGRQSHFHTRQNTSTNV